MPPTKAFIRYDIDKITKLKENYLENLRWMEKELPDIDWKSSKQIIKYFSEKHEICLQNTQIAHIVSHRDKYAHDTAEYDILNGAITYLKLRYTIQNYLDCILRHHQDGKIYLRLEGGNLLFPNKRPIPASPEIEGCLIHPNPQGETK